MELMHATSVIIEVPPRLDRPAIDALRRALSDAASTRVVVLRGRDPHTFCAGLDFEPALAAAPDVRRAGLQAYADLLFELRSLACATIALVEGEVFGGGVGLVCACDLVLAGDASRFGLPEALYGFYPAIVFAALAERVTPQRMRLLALQCDSIDALTARDCGLVDRVVAREDAERVLQRQVRRLQRAAPQAIAAIKTHPSHLASLTAALAQGVAATTALLDETGVQARLREAAMLEAGT